MHILLATIAASVVCDTLFTTFVSAQTRNNQSADDEIRGVIQSELEYLARIPNRRTGSPRHNRFINHLQRELEHLGLKVYSNTWYFDYNDSPLTHPKFIVEDEPVHVSSAVAYSGNTGPKGVSGPLVNLISADLMPDWEKARNGIAVLNITNPVDDRAATIPLWPGSPPWKPSYIQLPASVANVVVVNLTDAAKAGVKGIVYVWEHVSTRLARGQYGPFWSVYQGIPALFASPETYQTVVKAANKNLWAELTLMGKLIPNTPTRNIWVIIPGTERPHESVIINTHTDGVNIGEENGHIALLAYARSLLKSPPKRTTILAFITAHIHSGPFSYSTHRSTTLWLSENPSLWNGSAPNHLKAVFGSCVEHLGMLDFVEDLEANTYTPSTTPADEALFAATSELADLTFSEWIGAIPNFTRVINPLASGEPVQGGEGLPFLLNGIPEISLVTAPGWLLKQFRKEIDQKKFIDFDATYRQVESFERIWRRVDEMPKEKFGTIPTERMSRLKDTRHKMNPKHYK